MMKKVALLSLSVLFLFVSCKENNVPEIPEASDYTQHVNSFIYENMKAVYLWNGQIPELNLKQEIDSKAYFNKILYKKEDKFSIITNDVNSLLEGLKGSEKGFGYSLSFMWADASKSSVVAVVNYVYPNTPSADAGIMRGDIIMLLNGQKVTESNINNLIEAEKITIGLRKNGDKTSNISQISLTAKKTLNNPVHSAHVYVVNDKKVGYLFYTSYILDFNDYLKDLFARFKTVGVTEMILDLRYNQGGDEKAIVALCSQLAPASAVLKNDIIITNEYNKEFQQYLNQNNIDKNTYFDNSFMTTNLDLKRIFILTSGDTYSASEITAVGLKPYMDVICIGEKTGGKYTGMDFIQPYIMVNGQVVLDRTISNWAIMPVTCQYKNKNGLMPKEGIVPQYEVENFYWPMFELGNSNDPLIAKALGLISGESNKKSFSVSHSEKPYSKPFAYRTSRFDELKKNIISR